MSAQPICSRMLSLKHHHPSSRIVTGLILVFALICTIGILQAVGWLNLLSGQTKPSPTTRPAQYFLKEDPTQTWSTYVNKRIPVTLRIPSYFEIDAGETYLRISTISAQTKALRLGRETILSPDDMIIEVSMAPSNKRSLFEITDALLANAEVLKIGKMANTTLGGADAVRYHWETFGDGESVESLYRGFYIRIEKSPLVTSHQREFEQILLSLRFDE